MEENGQFLHYKGETFDTISHPAPYEPILNAKYAGLFVSVHDGKPRVKMSKKETRLWKQFGNLTTEQQERLAEISYRKRRRNYEDWHTWMRQSVKKQLKVAKEGTEND
jgi:hypothetical protein